MRLPTLLFAAVAVLAARSGDRTDAEHSTDDPGIRGVPVEPDGRPLASMVVRVRLPDAPHRCEAVVTDAEGRLTVAGLAGVERVLHARVLRLRPAVPDRAGALQSYGAGGTGARIVAPPADEWEDRRRMILWRRGPLTRLAVAGAVRAEKKEESPPDALLRRIDAALFFGEHEVRGRKEKGDVEKR